MQNKYWCKSKLILIQFLGRAEGRFQEGRPRIKYFAISNKIYDMKTTLILNREYKKLPSTKNILGDFCYVQFCYCTIGCTSKSQNRKWHRIQQVPWYAWSSYCGVFTRETVKLLCQTMARYRLFVFVSFLFLSSVIKFDKKCADSTQRSQSPNSLGWPLFLQSQKKKLSKTRLFIIR